MYSLSKTPIALDAAHAIVRAHFGGSAQVAAQLLAAADPAGVPKAGEALPAELPHNATGEGGYGANMRPNPACSRRCSAAPARATPPACSSPARHG